eukprot:TRINITY_DN2879_c0_g2_i1.p1 TRINITY_DN2879_c0_g2~~TRINITY_DN2879_c0_g2_i1.p1  ORF type:complete len:654 (-),score=161.21 TRINITY_DN2879_c0_g2_i1:54-2015(-)
MSKLGQIKNKSAAPQQITAEQILRGAIAQKENEIIAPKQKIVDPEELADYQFKKRKGYEDAIRKNRTAMGNWIRYASWEESQKELTRARSIFERAIDVDYRSDVLWLKYAEMEIRAKDTNRARNIYDRAVTVLPRVDQFWLKYAYMENVLGNFGQCRQIYERWMEWQPDPPAWNAFIQFEIKCQEIERARKIYERFVQVHPVPASFLKWARFEERFEPLLARQVYEKAIEYLGEEANEEKLFIAFSKYEESMKEIERARAIYKYALDHIAKRDAQEIYKTWISFEKKNGDQMGIEDVIIGKRRFQYEEEIKNSPNNYDVWFDYARLEESYGQDEKIREVYERAIAMQPPATEKRYWKRYIYLWINYAIFEELEAKDVSRTRSVYKAALDIIPHRIFSFSKLWILFANFELRQKDLNAARSIFGHAIGKSPKNKIFKSYIELEQQLGEVDRVRKIYEKWLECNASFTDTWIGYANYESSLDEMKRTRAIYELAVSQPVLDMPELLWKSFIDFEIEQGEYDNVRNLFRRLLDRTKHVKVWIAFAQFETSIEQISLARDVFSEGFDALKMAQDKEERVLLLNTWREFEEIHGDESSISKVDKKMPKQIIKRRQKKNENGEIIGTEEYNDYVFPGEEQQSALKLLERAKLWKKQEVA